MMPAIQRISKLRVLSIFQNLTRNLFLTGVLMLSFASAQWKNFCRIKAKRLLLPSDTNRDQGAVAQSVEQRTENPCVGGSIPPHTTKTPTFICWGFCFRKLTAEPDYQ